VTINLDKFFWFCAGNHKLAWCLLLLNAQNNTFWGFYTNCSRAKLNHVRVLSR
jgi:hypothetical protein